MTTGDAGGFAALLRQRRRWAGLTQSKLAALSGVAVRTVRDVERGRTGRPQRTTVELLADALRLDGDERAEFLAAASGERMPVTRPAGAIAGGIPLPPAVPLIGRDDEVAGLVKLVSEPLAGPVALVGLAGVGKSALALAVAHRAADRFPGGVAGVTTAEEGDSAGALAGICSVFGVADHEELVQRFSREPALLLLDAVERAPGKMREVLGQLPARLRVITAGQVPLGVPGERVWPVVPLETPPAATDLELAEIATYPAAALFLDRLTRVRTAPLADDEVPALVGLVRRLGGLPLALELAAAHGRLLRLPEILQRYGDRVLDLGGGTDQTLREAVAGSYRLLTPPEQHALRWLAVFRHRWSVSLAEQLLGDLGDPLPWLDRLVSLGLVAVSGARAHRFRLLDVVRDFATEQADQHGELVRARRAHARVIAALVDQAAVDLAGPGLRAAAARLDDLAADVWAALSHAANDEPHTALRLAAQLSRWWRLRGRDKTGRRWLRRLLDDRRTADADPAVRAWAQVGLARLANEHGEAAAEQAATEAALEEFRRLGDVSGELAACNVLSALCLASGRYGEARRHTEAALALAVRHRRPRDATVAQTNLTWHDIRTGDLAAARQRLARVDRLAAQLGDERLRVLATANLAEVARLQGRYDEAVAIGHRALARLGTLGDPGHRRRVLGTVGQALAVLGRTGEAEQVLASLRSMDSAVGTPGTEAVCAAIEGRVAFVRGDRQAAAEWFAAAVTAARRGQDRRDVVEALACLAACMTGGDRRARVLAELDRVADGGGFVLLPVERELLAQAGG
jgi:predicted ATPase/transcriptional regulator with XRE-family HTH domain